MQQNVQQAPALAATVDGTIKFHLEFNGKIAEQGETIENESISWLILKVLPSSPALTDSRPKR